LQLAHEQKCSTILAYADDQINCDVRPSCEVEMQGGTGVAAAQCLAVVEAWELRCEGISRSHAEAEALAQAWADVPDDPGPGNDLPVIDGSTLISRLDSTAWLGGGSCPVFPPVQALGVTLDLGAGGAWCDFLLLLKAMVTATAMFVSLRILVGG